MLINTLSKIYKKMPSRVKSIFHSMVRKKVIENSEFIHTMKRLKTFDTYDDSKQKRIQRMEIKKILTYAYEHTKFYKRAFDDYGFNPYKLEDITEIKRLPIIDKSVIIENYDEFQSDEYLKYNKETIGYRAGKKFDLLLETNSLYKEKAFIYNMWEKTGYDYKNTINFTIMGIDKLKNKKFKVNSRDNEVIVPPQLINDETIKEYVGLINRQKIKFIQGYPSGIKRFCNLAYKYDLLDQLNISAVFFISENLYEEDKKYVEKILKTTVISFYKQTERLAFAEEIDGSYRFNKLYGYTELIPRIDNTYDIVCTGFINKMMPMIRYKTGDVAYSIDGKLRIIEQRDMEILICKNNIELTLNTLNYKNNLLGEYDLEEYQFIQDIPGEAVMFVISNKMDDSMIKSMERDIQFKLRDLLDIEIKRVDKILLSKAGKQSKVINRFNYRYCV